jgi:RNA recognition motif-containing protein
VHKTANFITRSAFDCLCLLFVQCIHFILSAPIPSPSPSPSRDAEDAVRNEVGRPILGRRVKVEIAKASPNMGSGGGGAFTGGRSNQPFVSHRKTEWRLLLSGLRLGISWQDMRDHCRDHSISVIYAGARTADGATIGVLEFESQDAMKAALVKLADAKFQGQPVLVEIETPERNFNSSAVTARERDNRDQQQLPPPTRARSRSRSRDRRDEPVEASHAASARHEEDDRERRHEE